MKKKLSREDCKIAASLIADVISGRLHPDPIVLYGVPRGGIPAAYMVAEALEKKGRAASVVYTPSKAHYIIDDLIDSGGTKLRYRAEYPTKNFYALFHKMQNDATWFVFPWEKEENSGADDIPLRLLQYIGEDTERGGLLETPKRFLKAWDHWTSGYNTNPEDILKVFEDGAQNYDEMVLVKDIPAYSKCEHHLADIFGVAHVAYIPNGRIVGLSKLNRLVDMYGRRLQVQERWTVQIADALMKHLKPKGVAVVIEARHMCMESRGVCQQGHSTVTSSTQGVFRDSASTREEFMRLIK